MAADQGSSPLADLHSIHTRIARTMEQLDSAFVRAHKLGMARQLTSNELRAFVSSMQEVEALMQIWVPFFEEASSRPPAPLPPQDALATRDGLLSLTPSNPSTPAGDLGDPFTTPLTSSVPNRFPFCTPDSTPAGVNNLTAYSQHPTPYPDRREVDDTLEHEATSDRGEVRVPGENIAGEISPLPPTPSMLSPPRSCFVLKNRDSNASSSSFTITPSSESPRTPVSFQRGPLSALGHNQTAGNQRNELLQQGLLGKGDGRTRGAMSDEFGEQENQGPVREEVNFGPERLPDHVVQQNWARATLLRSHSMNGPAGGPAPSPFRTPGVTRLMRLSPSGPSPVSPVQNLSFDSPATFATWQKKTRPRTAPDSSDGSPELRTPEMDSPPATTELQKMDGPDFGAMSPRIERLPPNGSFETGVVNRPLSDAERLGRVEKILKRGFGGLVKEPVNPFDLPEKLGGLGRVSPFDFSDKLEGLQREPVNPFEFPKRFAAVGGLGLKDHSPSKAHARPSEWVGRKTVDVAEVMRGDDVTASDWKDGVAALRGLHVSKSATLPHGIDPLEVDVRPDFEPTDGAAALLGKKGFGPKLDQGLGLNLDGAFGLEGSPGWMDGRLALKAYGLDTPTGPAAKTARLVQPSTEPEQSSPPQKSPVGSPGQSWKEAKLETVGEWVTATTAANLPGEETPERFLARWGGASSEARSHRRSRSHDLGARGTPRSDLGFCSPRGPQKGEWAAQNVKRLVLEDTDVINDGKENINPNVGAAGLESEGLDLSAFPPVFRTGEGAQQLLMVFQQFPPPRIHGGRTLTGRDGSLSLSELDGLLVGYGTERLSLLLDLLASRGALQPFIVGRQMRWERPPQE